MLQICVMLSTLPCNVEEENRLEAYGLFTPIFKSDWTIRITRED